MCDTFSGAHPGAPLRGVEHYVSFDFVGATPCGCPFYLSYAEALFNIFWAAVHPHMLSARTGYCILQNIYEYCKLQMNIVHGTSGGAQTGVAFLCFKYDEKHRNVLTKR